MSRVNRLGRTTVRRMALLAAALALLAASASPAWAATETGHHAQIVIDDPDNPCTPAVGTAWVNYVYHESTAANGSVHVTGTETGTFTVTDGQGGPEATGHYTVWFGANFNSQQVGFWITLRAKGEYEDGTPVEFTMVIQQRDGSQPNFLQFNCFDGTGVIRVPLA